MSSVAEQDKVIRVGVRIDDQVVEERVVAARKDLILGGTGENAIAVQTTGIEGEYPLLVWRDGKYYVRLRAPMKGKVSSLGHDFQIDAIIKKSDFERDGDAVLVPLNGDDKGMINLGTTNLGKTRVLFRFVEAPPAVTVAPVPSPNTATQTVSYANEADRIFTQFLGTFSVLAVMFAVYVQNAPPVEVDREAARARLSELVIERVQVKKPVVTAESGKKPEEAAPEKAEEKTKAENAPDKVAQKVDQPREAGIEAAKSRMEAAFQILSIGTQGRASTGRTTLADPNVGSNLAELMQRGAKNEQGGGVGTGVRGGGTVNGGGDGSIGGPAVAQQAATEVVKPPPVIRAKLSSGEPETDPAIAGPVKATVNRQKATLKLCYEAELKANPDLAGKVVVSWSIVAGAARSVEVESNSTGSDKLASCIVSKIRTWKFEGVDDGETKMPFVFSAEKE